MDEAYFARQEGEFVPRPHAGSPWSPDLLHGRLFAGLAARAVHDDHGQDGHRIARLTVDLSKAAPLQPVTVTATRVRDGRRVRTVDVRVECQGIEVARATALLLREGDDPGGRVWGAEPWDVPPPEDIPVSPARAEIEAAGHPDLRFVGGVAMEAPVRKQVWLHDQRPLVDGEPLLPAVRAAIAADVANPIVNFSDTGLHFINADLTLAMAREPVGEWIGLDVSDRQSADGISIGSCALHDAKGRFGQVIVCAVATPRFGQ